MDNIQFNHNAKSGIESFGLNHFEFNKKMASLITLFFSVLEEDDRRHSRLGEFLAEHLNDTEILFLATCHTVDMIRDFNSQIENQINNN